MVDTMLARQVRGEVARATGHHYPHLERACVELDTNALHDLLRLIRDLQQEAMSERAKRRRGQFW